MCYFWESQNILVPCDTFLCEFKVSDRNYVTMVHGLKYLLYSWTVMSV